MLNRRNSTSFVVGIVLFVGMLLLAVVGPVFSGYDPNRGEITARLLPPFSPGHIVGTDGLGRDLATRLMYGARMSLYMSGMGVILAMAFGVTVGLVAGFVGGWIDAVLMRLVDVQLAFPFILLALTLVTAVPPTPVTLMLLLALGAWVLFARTVRGSVLKEINREYVQGAVVLGASKTRIALRYVLPNIVPTIAIIAALELAALILFESTLSYLGVGIQPPTASWGGIMLEGQTYMRTAWWITTLPGVLLFITTLGLNMVGEGLRDLLDPRLQR
jgi:peptide/nickel transport system permease protein